MAHSGHPDTAGSQFFICLDDAPHLDGEVHRVWKSDQRRRCAGKTWEHAGEGVSRRTEQAERAGGVEEREDRSGGFDQVTLNSDLRV